MRNKKIVEQASTSNVLLLFSWNHSNFNCELLSCVWSLTGHWRTPMNKVNCAICVPCTVSCHFFWILCLQYPISTPRDIVKDKEAWHAAVHAVAKSRTWLSDWTTKIKHRIPVAPLCMRVQWDSKHIQGHYVVYNWVGGNIDSLSLNQHVSKTKRNQQSYEKHERPRNPVIFFLTHGNPCIGHSLTLRMTTQRKKEKASTVLFFSVFLT